MSIKLQNRHTPIRQLKIISFNLVYDLRLYNLLWPTRELKSVHEIDISNHFSGSESVRFVFKKSDQRGTCLQLNEYIECKPFVADKEYRLRQTSNNIKLLCIFPFISFPES